MGYNKESRTFFQWRKENSKILQEKKHCKNIYEHTRECAGGGTEKNTARRLKTLHENKKHCKKIKNTARKKKDCKNIHEHTRECAGGGAERACHGVYLPLCSIF